MDTHSRSISANLDATTHSTACNLQSGSEVAAVDGPTREQKWAGRWSKLGADHSKRWEKRLYIPKSGGVALNKLAVRIQHLGRREEFRFETTNKEAAAKDALQIFRHLKTNGWEATLAKYKPEPEAPGTKLPTTVGQLLTAVEETGRLRGRTFRNYRNALRLIVAEAFGVQPDDGVSKFDYINRGHERFNAKIDAHRLDELTVDRITAWKRQRLAAVGHAPNALASARRSINSYIRNARSLFAPRLLKEVKGCALPNPLPFAGVEFEEKGSTKYMGKIDAVSLIRAGQKDLRRRDPEAYKALLLGLCVGLRKAEIDLIEWGMVHREDKSIRLVETEWLALKTPESAAVLPVDPQVMDELCAMKPKPTRRPRRWSQFVLASNRPPRPGADAAYYRCERTFERLIAWLRSKGVDAQKPIHELRKELGALIASEHGIFAASRHLRHTDIHVTNQHYAAQKGRITVGLGKHLDTAKRAANNREKKQ